MGLVISSEGGMLNLLETLRQLDFKVRDICQSDIESFDQTTKRIVPAAPNAATYVALQLLSPLPLDCGCSSGPHAGSHSRVQP